MATGQSFSKGMLSQVDLASHPKILTQDPLRHRVEMGCLGRRRSRVCTITAVVNRLGHLDLPSRPTGGIIFRA